MQRNVAITESYLHSVFQLDNQSKRLTLSTIKQLSSNLRSPSLQIHSIDRQKCDEKFRSARVNADLRVIFAMHGDTYTLLYVGHHDDAYNWCNGKYLAKTNFGAEYIFDERVMLAERSVDEASEFFQGYFAKPLMESSDIKEKHLVKLGIPAIHAKNLLKITSEDSFIDYIAIFPTEIQEALLEIATKSKPFNEVYSLLIDANYKDDESQPLTQKDSKRRFYVTQSLEELELIMANESFEKWTIFLHPSQEKLVTANFNGPVLIEGGPGTGKTIVGIHRATYLAEHNYPADEGKRILLCTFSKKLAKVIEQKLYILLAQRGIKNNIDVVSVDSFIFNTLKSSYGSIFPVDIPAFSNMFDRLYDHIKPRGTKGFYQYEFTEIIERYQIKTQEEYLAVDRSGTGMPLSLKGRLIAWDFISTILQEKERERIYTFSDRSAALLKGIKNGTIQPMYDSIIVDEAQDLEPLKLKALCACVRSDKNNIMILSDVNQRIFKLSTWKNDVGIWVAGRTYHLDINYRTTKQIHDYARHQFINSEMTLSHMKEYKSIVNGVEPTVYGFTSQSEQYKYIVTKVNELLHASYEPHQICIVCPTRDDCSKVHSVLSFSEIKAKVLIDDAIPTAGSGVCICPIAGVKGLEFEVVIIYNYNTIGNGRLIDAEIKSIRSNKIKLTECEKYVAATRARDDLVITYVKVDE